MCEENIDRGYKLRLMERLKAQGVWDEARALKEKLRLDGEDNATAWEYVAEEYPPVDDEETPWGSYRESSPEEEVELSELIEKFEASGIAPDVRADMDWAYRTIPKDLTPKDCPTPGAWTWYKFCLTNPTKFMEMVWHSYQARKKEGNQRPRFDWDEAETRRQIDAVLKKLRDAGVCRKE